MNPNISTFGTEARPVTKRPLEAFRQKYLSTTFMRTMLWIDVLEGAAGEILPGSVKSVQLNESGPSTVCVSDM
jgi:hypothetical protein